MTTTLHATGAARRALRGLLSAAALVVLPAGLPYALVRFSGWPLPHHLPKLDDLPELVLATPSTDLLLNTLTCACWVLWAAFAVDVLRTAVAVARGTEPLLHSTAPVRRAVAVLVGSLLVMLLGERTGSAATAVDELTRTTYSASDENLQQSAIVQPPDSHGVHDSLWRIAERLLGDGAKWLEIWKLNENKVLPGGRIFNDPGLIMPGDALELPGRPPTPALTAPLPAPDSAPEPEPELPANASPQEAVLPAEPPSTPTAVSWGNELHVGLALAAAVGAALVRARHLRRRRYRPGSGGRDDLATSPAVYQLRLAHSQADPEAPCPDTAFPLGAREGHQIALDLASARGLGLVGPGAVDAARALLVTALSGTGGFQRLIVTSDVASALLGAATHPPKLTVAHDLDAALDLLDVEFHQRITSTEESQQVLLVAPAPDHVDPRLQALLDNGATEGITGLLLGQWLPGATVYVLDDGTLSSGSPGLGASLTGARLFSLGHDHAADLLTLLTGEPQREGTSAAGPGLEVEQVESEGPPPTEADEAPASRTVEQPDRPPAPLRMTVFGQPRLFWRPQPDSDDEQEITAAFPPRTRELLVFLALHDGVSRDALIAALWPTSTKEKTTNSLNTALSRARKAVTAATGGAVRDIVTTGQGRYLLDLDLVDSDHRRFAAALTARRAARTDEELVRAHQAVVDNYPATLAEGMTGEWLEAARESRRRDALDAVAYLARVSVKQNPQRTLELLEFARLVDPYNELVYRDIMRVQAKLGQVDAVARTAALLGASLAEVGGVPDEETEELARRLQCGEVSAQE